MRNTLDSEPGWHEDPEGDSRERFWSGEYWKVRSFVREVIASCILFPILVLSNFKIAGWNYFLGRLDDSFVQEYLLFSGLALVFAYFLLKSLYRSWIFFYGIGTVCIGLSHIVHFLVGWKINTSQGGMDYVYVALLSLPVLSVFSALIVIWRQQNLDIRSNLRSDRIVAVFGLLISVLLMMAEFLPWVRDIKKAAAGFVKFKESGTNIYVQECCYLSDGSVFWALEVYLPLIGLGLLFLISTFGYRISNLAFLPSLVWCAQEGISFLAGLGVQDPLKTWTKSDVDINGLALVREGLFGGYFFVIGVIVLLVMMLVPQVISGRVES